MCGCFSFPPTKQLFIAADALTQGNKRCSSCSCSYTDVAEGGSKPECERGYARWSDEVWEQPAGGAGRGQPQREQQAGWGTQRRLWGETDLQEETETDKIWSFTVYCTGTVLSAVKSIMNYMNSLNMLHGYKWNPKHLVLSKSEQTLNYKLFIAK